MAGLRERLREGTRAQHEAFESLPFFAALLGKTLELPAYVGWVRALVTVVDALQACAESVGDAWVNRARLEPLLDALRDDAAAYDDVPMSNSGLVTPTLKLVERMRSRAETDPRSLLGALYVFEGSALGARVQAPHLVRFAREGRGVSYLTLQAQHGPKRWDEFCGHLSELTPSEREQEAIVGVASEVFDGLAAIARALDPTRDERGPGPLAWLNPEAGRHAVSHDPREVLAAIDAGMASWDASPYFAARYAARGRSFTRSDSAWLVTLANASEAETDRQLLWLARVLAARGMPSILLEEHLRILADALCAAVPERAAAYRRLGSAADRFESRRVHAVPAFDELAASFSGRGGPDRIGPLIVSAVADERNGCEGAVSSLVDWLRDRERFPLDWIAAVDDLLGRARAAASASER